MSSNTKMPKDEENDYDDDCQYIFPQRLMSILAEERNNDAICWLPHGRAFIIRNRQAFAEKVMPKFFSRKSKYSSFTRKLNRWNFVRVSSGPELGAYYHEFFLRDKPHLAAQMFCKNARTKIAMQSSDPTPTARPPQPQQPPQQQKLAASNKVEPAHVAVMRQQQHQVDPAMQMLLEHQLALCQQQMTPQTAHSLQAEMLASLIQQQQAQTSNQLVIQQQLEIAKKQQERMLQLQQLMALNLRQQNQKRKNNFRASAA